MVFFKRLDSHHIHDESKIQNRVYGINMNLYKTVTGLKGFLRHIHQYNIINDAHYEA